MGAAILLIAALFLGAIPFSRGEAKPAAGDRTIRIFVLSNGFHSDIAVPRQNGATMQDLQLDETDFPVDIEKVRYWALGWGSQTAYTSLLEISDLTLGMAVKSVAFDAAAMHVTPLGELNAGPRIFAFDLSPLQFDNLIANMSQWFASSIPQEATHGYGDRFYDAKGKFAPWMTCNTWTGRVLREIGINVGLWTPIPQSLEFGLQRVASNP